MAPTSPDPRRRCACTGLIAAPADPADPASIAAVTELHNAGELHQRWRYDRILAGELQIPETPAQTIARHAGIPIPTIRVLEDERIKPGPRPVRPAPDSWYGEADPTLSRLMDGDR